MAGEEGFEFDKLFFVAFSRVLSCLENARKSYTFNFLMFFPVFVPLIV